MNAQLEKLIELPKKAYETAMKFVLKGRHVQVNREKYFRKLVKRFYGNRPAEEQEQLLQTALAGSPLDILDEKQVKKAYNRIRWKYGSLVFMVSFFMTTVPDIMWVIVLTCAIDLYIFQCTQFRAMQKIMMLYGKPIDLNTNIGSGIDAILEVDRSGVMIGKYPLLQKMKSGMGFLAKQLVQKQGVKVVSKASRSVFMVIRRQCIKWFSVVVAKEDVNLVFGMFIPITCAIISGIVSAIILVPMCNKLRNKLVSERQAQQEETAEEPCCESI